MFFFLMAIVKYKKQFMNDESKGVQIVACVSMLIIGKIPLLFLLNLMCHIYYNFYD